MNKKIKIFATAIILVFLFLPTLCFWKVKENFVTLAGFEKPSPLPSFSLDKFVSCSFQKSFDAFYGKNFFLRKLLLKTKNQIYEYFNLGEFHSGYSGTILQGKGHELYEKAYWYPYYMGIPAVNPRYHKNFLEHKYLAQLTAGLKMDYMYILAPDKSGFYPENRSYLHSLMFKYKRSAPQPEFSKNLTKYNVPNFDSYTFLKKHDKDFKEKMFPTCGTHWNALAASLVLNEVLSIINKNKTPQNMYRINPFIGLKTASKNKKAIYEDDDLLRLLNLHHTPLKKSHNPLLPVYKHQNFSSNNGKVIIFGDSYTGQIAASLRLSKTFTDYNVHQFGNILPTSKQLLYMLPTARLFLVVYTSTKLFYPTSVERQIRGMISLLEEYISEKAEKCHFTPGKGFSRRERWGIWTCENSAELIMHIPQKLRGKEITLFIDNIRLIDKFTLSSGDQKIGDFREIPPGHFLVIKISEKYTKTKNLPLKFDFGKVKSPKERGLSQDKRRLGIGFKKILAI